MKIKMLIKGNYIVIDTEGLGLNKPKEKLYGRQLSYHTGYGVYSPNGELLKSGNFVTKEIFEDEELMQTAYYYDKLDEYYRMLREKEATERLYRNIIKQLEKDIKEYNVVALFAYNCNYDIVGICETTQKYTNKKCKLTFEKTEKGKNKPLFEKMLKEILNTDIEMYDIMTMACMSICQDKEYLKTVEYTSKGNPRTTAEAVYRYISGEKNFIEEHTAYQDSDIENQILQECFKRGVEPQKQVYFPYRLIPKELYKEVA